MRSLVLLIAICLFGNTLIMSSCQNSPQGQGSATDQFHLSVLAPGHFHAALLQKSMYSDIDSVVHVFSPSGDSEELGAYLNLVEGYNHREDSPTHWVEKVYTGPDYLNRMLQQSDRSKSIVVISGNNEQKMRYITSAIDSGMNVLGDKPMAINAEDFAHLKQAFQTAKDKGVLLYDIMTERYAMTSILQKMFVHMPEVFGTMAEGSATEPAIVFKSLHHFYKEVSGKPALRPTWFFDVHQQGEGIVDVSTHLVDLVQWECFPQTIFDYDKDVKLLAARHWPTTLDLAQYAQVTGVDSFPPFLNDAIKDNKLEVYANGEMDYTLKGIHARVGVDWEYAEPPGSGDTYYAKIEGTKATLVIHQDKAQQYVPYLYIKPVHHDTAWQAALQKGLDQVHQTYPGVSLDVEGDSLRVVIPDQFKTDHEQRFSRVVMQYLQYLKQQKIPDWEISFMETKYHLTTDALQKAQSSQ